LPLCMSQLCSLAALVADHVSVVNTKSFCMVSWLLSHQVLKSLTHRFDVSVNTVMVCRITLNLRTTVYGPTTFERTNNSNSFPLSDLRNPARSGRSDQTVESTLTRNLEVHIRKEYDRSKDYDHDFVEFTSGNASGSAYQTAGQEV